MIKRMLVAGFTAEHDLLRAVAAVRGHGSRIVEAYTPYAVHGLDEALGLRRSRLAVACFVCGLLGVVLALALQFWTTASDWPLNVGGQPWNSLPAFVPVTFEMMVLLGGLGLVFAWLVRCRLYPGKTVSLLMPGAMDDRFVLALEEPPTTEAEHELRQILQHHGAVSLVLEDHADQARGTEGPSSGHESFEP